MSALTERVAREHRPYRDPVAPGRLWLCGCDQGETSRDIVAHVRHVAEAAEAETRADVAADIRAKLHAAQRANLGQPMSNRWWHLHGCITAYDHAARIAEGKQP